MFCVEEGNTVPYLSGNTVCVVFQTTKGVVEFNMTTETAEWLARELVSLVMKARGCQAPAARMEA